MQDSFKQYTKDTDIQTVWDSTQQNLYCCGIDEPFDWTYHIIDGIPTTGNKGKYNVPFSCCEEEKQCDHTGGPIYSKGCWDVLKTLLLDVQQIAGLCSIVLAILQLTGFLCSVVLQVHIQHPDYFIRSEKHKARSNLYDYHNDSTTEVHKTDSTDADL